MKQSKINEELKVSEEQLELFDWDDNKIVLSANTENFSPRPEVTEEELTDEILKTKSAKEFGWDHDSASIIAKEYLSTFYDGYDLAKLLESNYIWDVCRKEMEALDNIRFIHYKLKKKLETEWAKQFEPLGEVNSRVRFKWSDRTLEGTINEITEAGKYVIFVQGDYGMPVVNWESCTIL